MSEKQILEVEGREVGVLEPQGDLLVFRASDPAARHLDGFTYSEPQSAYTDVCAQLHDQPDSGTGDSSGTA
jgi:hypothetical protein